VKIVNIKRIGSWRDVADAARTTINMEPGKGEPSDKWKKQMLLAEHSPIRKLRISAKFVDLPYWISVHLVRHKIGIEHFVRTQRTDRTGVDRSELPQGALVEHEIDVNYQAVMTISRKRTCGQAAEETRMAWQSLLGAILKIEPVLFDACAPECVYRGFCPEFKSCGYDYKKDFEEYRRV
jgi:hypothetical protein